jgi:hypothetical protein
VAWGVRPRFFDRPKGSVFAALPLLVMAMAFLPARAWAAFPSTQPGAGVQAGPEALWMAIYLPTDQLNIAPNALAYPTAPGSMLNLWGAGAVLGKNQLLLSVQGMTGDMMASDSGTGRSSAWNLDLAGVVAEQRYPTGNWEFTAGLAAWLGSFSINLRDIATGAYTRFESRFPAGGLTGAMRWPTHSHVCFFFRTGYFWLPASGSWNGSLAPAMVKSSFDLNTTFTQLGIDLIF